MSQRQMAKDQQSYEDSVLVLLGIKSKNKCMVGNMFLQEEFFNTEQELYARIATKVGDQLFCIINTPDNFHWLMPDPEAYRIEEVTPSYPGPRVFLLVLQENKVSEEEMKMFRRLKERFGEKMVENSLVVVVSSKEESSGELCKRAEENFRKVLDECGRRICVHNKNPDMKITELIREIMKIRDKIQKQVHDSNISASSGVEHLYEEVDDLGLMNLKLTSRVNQEHQPADVTKKTLHTIVLLGQTGSGKSATGNTILGKQCFESHVSSVPVTQQCQTEEGTVCGMKIRVIDTPDFFNEDLKNQAEQIKRCKQLIQHEPVVYLLVLELGHFTDGEREVLPHLKREFGEDVTTHAVILFTGKEKLKNKNLDDYISETDPELQQLIKTCNSRCLAFNNNKKDGHQVNQLMKIICKMQKDRNVLMAKSGQPKINTLNKLSEAQDCRML